MINDHTFAEKVLSESYECFDRLNALLISAQQALPAPEFEELRKGIGMVLGYLYTDVEAPIYRKHPDLEPAELRRGPSSE